MIDKFFKSTRSRRALLADKFMDTANYVLVALTLTSLAAGEIDLRRIIAGIIAYLLIIIMAYTIKP